MLQTVFITQGQNIDQYNQALPTPIEEFPSSCHTHPSLKKGGKSQWKPLVWDFKELGRNGTSGKSECELHGKSRRGHLLCHQSLSPRLLEVQPHGSGFLLGNGANEHITPAGTEGSVCGKGQLVNFQAQGVGQGLQFELNVWKPNIAQSIDYLTDSDPFLLRGQK